MLQGHLQNLTTKHLVHIIKIIYVTANTVCSCSLFSHLREALLQKINSVSIAKKKVPLSDSESIYHTLGNLIWQLQLSITDEKKDGHLKLIPLLTQKEPAPDIHLYEAVY